MDDISTFRGLSGEVSYASTRGNVFATVAFLGIIIGVILFIIGLVFGRAINSVPAYISNYILMVFPYIFIGRFALAASRGNVNCGFFNGENERGETTSFLLRFVILSLIWYVPLNLLMWLTLKNVHLNPFILVRSAGAFSVSSGKMLFLSIAQFVFTLLNILLPILTAIIVTASEDVQDILSLEPWRWLLRDRKEDLPALIGSLIGTIIYAFLKFFVPILIVSFIFTKFLIGINVLPSHIIWLITAGITLMAFAYYIILCGRLVGTFVYGESSLGEHSIDQAIPESPSTNLSKDEQLVKQAAASVAPKVKKLDLDAIKEEVSAVDARVISIKLGSAQEAHQENPEDVEAMLLLAYLEQAQDNSEQAMHYANLALNKLLANHNLKEALDVYSDFAEHSEDFHLTAPHWMKLAKTLKSHNRFVEACLAAYKSACVADDFKDMTKQKEIFAIADSANQAGQLEEAQTIYKFFLAKFPDSTLVDFAQEALTSIESKLNPL